jgi:hypothetical protein
MKNVICVSSVFFVFTDYIASNPLSEFCNIHLNFTAVGRQHEVYQELI